MFRAAAGVQAEAVEPVTVGAQRALYVDRVVHEIAMQVAPCADDALCFLGGVPDEGQVALAAGDDAFLQRSSG